MNNTDLPGRVRAARKERGWTQEQMAGRAGISLRTYQSFESRATSPQGANLTAILKAVDIDPQDAELAEATREEWSRDIRVFLDVMGAYLATMSDRERLDMMHRLTRLIFEGRLT